jgi:hypothetical protein
MMLVDILRFMENSATTDAAFRRNVEDELRQWMAVLRAEAGANELRVHAMMNAAAEIERALVVLETSVVEAAHHLRMALKHHATALQHLPETEAVAQSLAFLLEVPGIGGVTDSAIVFYEPALFNTIKALRAIEKTRLLDERREFSQCDDCLMAQQPLGYIGKIAYHWRDSADEEVGCFELLLHGQTWQRARDTALSRGLSRVLLVITGDPVFLANGRADYVWITQVLVHEVEGPEVGRQMLMRGLH